MTNFWEQNRSFLITFGVVLGSIILFFIVKSSTFWELLRTNLLYTLSLVLLTSIAWLVVQKLEWAPTKPHKISWFLFLLMMTIYYALSRQPNWLGLFGDLIAGHVTEGRFNNLLFGTATYAGLIYLFYYLLSFFKPDFFHYEKERISVITYSMWMSSFLIYLNATISIINPLFHRPF